MTAFFKQPSAFCHSFTCTTLRYSHTDRLKCFGCNSPAFAPSIIVQRFLKPEIKLVLLGVVQEFLVSSHRKHHSARASVMSEHSRAPVLFDLRRVFACLSCEVSEADDVLFENHDQRLAHNSVLIPQVFRTVRCVQRR